MGAFLPESGTQPRASTMGHGHSWWATTTSPPGSSPRAPPRQGCSERPLRGPLYGGARDRCALRGRPDAAGSPARLGTVVGGRARTGTNGGNGHRQRHPRVGGGQHRRSGDRPGRLASRPIPNVPHEGPQRMGKRPAACLGPTSLVLADRVGAETMLRELRELLVPQPDSARAHEQVAGAGGHGSKPAHNSAIGASSLTTADSGCSTIFPPTSRSPRSEVGCSSRAGRSRPIVRRSTGSWAPRRVRKPSRRPTSGCWSRPRAAKRTERRRHGSRRVNPEGSRRTLSRSRRTGPSWSRGRRRRQPVRSLRHRPVPTS